MYYFRQVQVQVTPLLQEIGVKPATAVVVLGYRGHATIEPASGHLNADLPKDRCQLREWVGDCMHSVLCAAGCSIRCFLPAIARKGLKALAALLRLLPALGASYLMRVSIKSNAVFLPLAPSDMRLVA